MVPELENYLAIALVGAVVLGVVAMALLGLVRRMSSAMSEYADVQGKLIRQLTRLEVEVVELRKRVNDVCPKQKKFDFPTGEFKGSDDATR